MFSYIVIMIVFLLLISTAQVARKYPHLRKMAIRNLLIHKQTTILTIIGAMIGTALITTSLLMDHSISKSVDRVYEEQLGNIVGDLRAIDQKALSTSFFSEVDLRQMEKDNQSTGQSVAAMLPIVSHEGMLLMKLDDDGQPLILNPKTYVFGVNEEEALKFDKQAINGVPLSLKENEIILSERTATILEVVEGNRVVVVDDEQHSHPFIVHKVVPEQGLTGYRGINRATSTAIVSLEKARKLVGMDEEGYTNVLTTKLPNRFGKLEYHHSYSPGRNWDTVPVASNKSHELEKSSKLLPIFTISSITAIIIGMFLIINVFKMVAEERRQEFGILRAIGLSEEDLSRLLKIEGSIYAAIAGVIGTAFGIGLAYILLLRLKDVLATAMEYSFGLSIRYEFSVDPLTLLTGFSIGLLLVYVCIALITNKAVKISIVDAIAVNAGEKQGQREVNGRSPLRIGIIVLLFISTFSLFLFTRSNFLMDVVRNSPVAPLFIFVVSFALLLFIVLTVIFAMPYMLTFIKYVLKSFPRMNGTINLALRYPEVNPTRTSMLIIMFSLVLFLTSFSGVFSKTMENHIGSFHPDTATASFDLLAKNINSTTEKAEIEKMLLHSKYIDSSLIEDIALVSQGKVDGYYDYINGIDETFAEKNTISFLSRDSRFQDDREAWQAVLDNSNLIIISEFRLDRDLTIGDEITFETKSRPISKEVVAIAKYESDSYEFPTSYGMWINEDALSEIIYDERQISKTVLLTVDKSYPLSETANNLEKEFTLNNIYPLVNPTEMAVVSGSFILMFFSLFEGFNALATIIGITGLMTVMIRVIRERRQQIGMLRAIGISPRLIYWSYLVEGGIIAIMGITIGVVVGAYGGELMLQSLMNDTRQEIEKIEVIFPYLKISLYYMAALVLTLVFIAIPARTTMKLPPAEATRYIS